MVVSDMIKQVQDITKISRSDAELVNDFNRGLLDLSSALFLLETFSIPWEAGEESYLAPPSVIEFKRYATFYTPGQELFQLPRVQKGVGRQGWWYDGTNIGIQTNSGQPIGVDGTFDLQYFRYPKVLSAANTFDEPDGGDSVSQALINYSCYVSYATLGDEVSMSIANNYKQFYEQAKERIYYQRSRLVNTTPLSWRLK